MDVVKTPAQIKICVYTTSGILLSLNKKILWAMGLWYPRNASASKYRMYFYFSWFMTLGLLAHISTEIVAMYVYSDDVKVVLNIFCPMLSGLGSFFKAVYTIYKKYEMQDLVNKLEGPKFAYNHQREDAQQNVITKACQLSKMITAVFEILCVFIVTLWMMAPVLFEDPTSPLAQPLPLPASFPWDLETPAGYATAYIFQIITCYTTTSVIAGVDTLCVSMLIHVGGQLESLAITLDNLIETVNKEFQSMNKIISKDIYIEDVNTALTNFKEKNESRENTREHLKYKENTAYSRAENQDVMREFTEMESRAYQQLIQCINHHEAIIRFAEEVQDLFSPVMLFQCASSTIILCFVAFLLTESSGDTGSLIKCIVYLIVGTYELWLYCVFGDRVIDLSTRLSQAAYGCEWVRASPRFKKALTMIIMRSQKPILFKGGFLYVVSLQTFASLINASYSYFTILQAKV